MSKMVSVQTTNSPDVTSELSREAPSKETDDVLHMFQQIDVLEQQIRRQNEEIDALRTTCERYRTERDKARVTANVAVRERDASIAVTLRVGQEYHALRSQNDSLSGTVDRLYDSQQSLRTRVMGMLRSTDPATRSPRRVEVDVGGPRSGSRERWQSDSRTASTWDGTGRRGSFEIDWKTDNRPVQERSSQRRTFMFTRM